jgi:DNA polymerase I-like protein with 3'-5' exonuclease and polymerase domains
MLETYDARFPWVKEASDRHKEMAERRGEIILLGGYRARFARKPGQVGDFPHKAFNRRVQGSAAAQTKRSMIAYKELTGRCPLVTVHDENGCSGGPRERAAMVEAMVGSYAEALSVPFRADVSIGKTWGEAALAED